MQPSRFPISQVERKLSTLKEIRSRVDAENPQYRILSVKISNLQDELDKLRDWYDECRLNGYC